ncbi:PrgI family protein [Lactococcus lactis]|uniref:PrgI family protein n=1 Tax=Lactococcus lactis TaxID=1358 RepID=UPI0012934527|nr:PrgI family protein [Lactococcus lactis]MQQ79404.1 PrgI family protein [Lactococcus lactis]
MNNNNNFVTDIPQDLKKIKARLFFGLTKRQAIGVAVIVLIGIPLFLFLKTFSIDIAMWALMFVAIPIFGISTFQKNGMYAEKWLKLYIEYKYLSALKRKYKITKKNKKFAIERGIIRVRK